MHRITLAALVVAALLVPALASGNEGTKGNGLSYCEENYLDLYQQVDPDGPNIVKDGLPDGSAPNDERVCRKVDILVDIKEAQEAAEAAPVAESTGTSEVTSAGTSSGYAIPDYIVQCESGGDYSAQNPSGAYGAYQIMPSTAASYGCDLSTPAGQDACAAEIYATEGASPWSCG